VRVLSEDLGMEFTIINVYGPNLDHVPFWESLLSKDFMQGNDLILGGDLNFSMGST
jgi:hypothetical protein